MTPDCGPLLAHLHPDIPAEAWQLTPAGQAGSQRRFWRLRHADHRYILMQWDAADPDWPYREAIDAALDATPGPWQGITPATFGRDPQRGLILEEDLGTTTLRASAGSPAMARHYDAALDALLRWQQLPWRRHATIADRTMDRELLLWESAYFATHTVAGHLQRPELLTSVWEEERRRLAQVVDALPKVWMHRDFQSENILAQGDRVRFVDYQGARPGPAAYDLASLIYDPYVPALQPAFAQRLRERFCQATKIDPADADRCAAQRLMQALGAYGKLSRVDGKRHYLAYIPLALDRLIAVLERLPEFPHLRHIAESCKQGPP